jgi:hypothetical protein
MVCEWASSSSSSSASASASASAGVCGGGNKGSKRRLEEGENDDGAQRGNNNVGERRAASAPAPAPAPPEPPRRTSHSDFSGPGGGAAAVTELVFEVATQPAVDLHPAISMLLRSIVAGEQSLAQRSSGSRSGEAVLGPAEAKKMRPALAPVSNSVATFRQQEGPPVSTSTKRNTKKRVRFRTYEMSAVDTPQMCARGSEVPMLELVRNMASIFRAARSLYVLASSGTTSQSSAVRKQLEDYLEGLEDLARKHPGGEQQQAPPSLREGRQWSAYHAQACLFYASEIRALCLDGCRGEHGCSCGSGRSVLFPRFMDAVHSIIRHELKMILNICHTQLGPEGCEASPCSCLCVLEGTGTFLFNNDDPAALLSNALQRMYGLRLTSPEIESWLLPELALSQCDLDGDEAALHDAAWVRGGLRRALTGNSEAMPSEEVLLDVLGYTASHKFAHQVFGEHSVQLRLRDGRWDRIEALAGMVCSPHASSCSPLPACIGCMAVLGDPAGFAQALAEHAKAVDQLEKAARAELLLVRRKALNSRNGRKRLASRLTEGREEPILFPLVCSACHVDTFMV